MPRPPRTSHARGSRLAAVLALGVAPAAAPSLVTAGGVAPGDARVARLRAELELARSGAFYLRLDPARRTLELALSGVVLERFPALAIERGTPRVAFQSRPAPTGEERVRYGRGLLEPARERDRIEIVAANAGAEPTPPPIPPTAEESVSVPDRWRLVFAEGLIVEVASRGGHRHRSALRRVADAWSLWWADRGRALAPEGGRRVWLRVHLAPEHAAALYRGLPPDVSLVVVGGPVR